ncbi:DNA-binding protein [Spirochaetia bacterium]|nr:DNA-binding protein [Spirochaetia bacterium]
MPSVRVAISPNILNWVLDISKYTGISGEVLESLHQWRNDEIRPTYNQLETISKKTHIPLGYFFLQTPPKETFPLLEYRTVESGAIHNPSRNLIDTIHHMEDIQDWMREYLQSNNYDKLPFVESLKNETDIQTIANAIRMKIELPIDWYSECVNVDDSFRYLRTHFENAGILILMNGVVGQNNYRILDIEEFRAFVLLDEYAPLVFVNSTDSKYGKLFSLLHEAVHIWLGENDFFNDRYGSYEGNEKPQSKLCGIEDLSLKSMYRGGTNPPHPQYSGASSGVLNQGIRNKPLEALCNAVTAEILVPKNQFVTEWQQKIQAVEQLNDIISLIAAHFKCGTTVIARRALDHDFISQKQYDAIAEEAKKNFKPNRASGGDYYRTNISRLGRPFVLALESSVREGKTTYTDAFRLTNTTRMTFDVLTNEARGER